MKESSEHGWHHGMHHFRNRNALDIKEIIDFLDIKEGESVLDLGGGDGFFTKEIAKKTKNVTIIDLYEGNFEELQKMSIRTIKGDICHYDNDSYDLVFISNVYHDLVHSCRENVLRNIQKISKKKVAVLDFKPEITTFGPPSWLRISKEEVIKNFGQIGFHPVKEKDLNSHYLLMFEKYY